MVPQSPLDLHRASPRELQSRLEAERRAAPFLVFRDGADAQRIVTLDRSVARLTIGRRTASDVALPWDGEVSRVHAVLERAGDEWLVVDDGVSRNGTWVNGERVTGRRRLIDGDLIRVGATAIAFRAPPADDSRAQETVSAGDRAAAVALTPGQRRVLVALCRPYADDPGAAPATNQQIAAELVVSIDAVKTTLRALFARFGVADRPQNAKRAALARAALHSGAVTRRDLAPPVARSGPPGPSRGS